MTGLVLLLLPLLASCDCDNLVFTWSKAESERVFTLLVTTPTPSSVRMVTSTLQFLSTCGHARSRSAPYFLYFLPSPPCLVYPPPGDNQSKATKFPPFWRPVSSRAGTKLRNINENGDFQVSFFTSWSLRVTRNFNSTSPKVQKTSIFIAMKEKIKTRSYLCCENCARAALCVGNINRWKSPK